MCQLQIFAFKNALSFLNFFIIKLIGKLLHTYMIFLKLFCNCDGLL